MIDPKHICSIVQKHTEVIEAHCKTLDIYEGNLTPYVVHSIKQQLSEKTAPLALTRMVPINILPKVIDKMSNIYQQGIIREIADGNDSDGDLLSWYSEVFKVNDTMHHGNTLYNACRSTLIHPYITDANRPALRVIPNDKFIVYSSDPINPTKPTGVILLAGKKDERDIYWVYTQDEFKVVLSDQSIDFDAMARMGIPDGVNPYGVLPFVYVNSSKLRLCPVPDDDALRMSVVLPVMLTDLNMAAMFQSFSVMYTIDTSIENMPFSPNAVWNLKSDNPEAKPEIGTIKPQVDIQEVLSLIQSELSMWLGSKGIRASAVGELTADNFASGISKVIDEMDTLDARQEQTAVFADGEAELWNLIFNHMHPYWVAQGWVENRAAWTAGATVKTLFRLALPGSTRTQLIDEQIKEVDAGFTTKKRAIMALNPTMTEAEVDELIEDIAEESALKVEYSTETQQDDGVIDADEVAAG